MNPPLLKQDLDQCKCPNPGCTGEHPVQLFAKCHPGNPFVVEYYMGQLRMSCSKCDAPVCRVTVAEATVQ